MAGKPGRSGRRTVKSIIRKCELEINQNSVEIMRAYIQKGLDGNAQILIDLVNRLMGEAPKVIDVNIKGQIGADNAALLYREARERFELEAQKLLPASPGVNTSVLNAGTNYS